MTDWWRGHPGDERLIAYLQGDLEGSAARRVAEHLSTCAPCRTTAELVANALSADESGARMPLPDAARVRQMVAGSAARSGRPRRVPFAGATAALVLLALGALGGRAWTVEFRDATSRPLRPVEAAALTAHRSHVKAETASPAFARERVIAAIDRDTGVRLRLVDHSGQPRVRWRGADVLGVGNARAGVVHAEVDGAAVTLITAHASAVDGPQPWSWRFKRVETRLAPDGARIFSWTNSGQSYVLVAAEKVGTTACLLCHTTVP